MLTHCGCHSVGVAVYMTQEAVQLHVTTAGSQRELYIQAWTPDHDMPRLQSML